MITLKRPASARRISLRAEQLTYVVGFVFLFAFLIWITGFDIVRRPVSGGLVSAPGRRCVRGGVRPSASTSAGVLVGSAHPVVVQSMTNTDTADADATAIQVARLAHAGSQLVRVTVNTEEAAAAVPEMVRKVARPRRRRADHRRLPLQRPQAPGRVSRRWPPPSRSTGSTRATSAPSATTSTSRRSSRSPSTTTSRSGSGSTGARSTRRILTELMDANARLAEPRDARDVMIEAMLESAMRSAELAEADRAAATTGSSCRPRSRACATSSTSTACSRARSDYPLHLGLTEAGMGDKGIVASTAGLAILLNEGIGDTIRVSLTPGARGAARARGRGRPAGPPVDGPALVPAPGLAPARAAAGRPRRSSRRWPSRSRPT